MSKTNDNEIDIPFHWQKIQSAIWLLGLALLAWQGWWWPGILVLVAISGLAQGAIYWYIGRQQKEVLITRARVVGLPDTCPNCGGTVDPTTVKWTSDTMANCAYCGSGLKVQLEQSLGSKP